MNPITYLRKGRKVRATGSIVTSYPNGTMKVKPDRPDWKSVIVTQQEVDAGSEKPPIIPRAPKAQTEPKPKRPPKPKEPVINSDELALPLTPEEARQNYKKLHDIPVGARLMLMFGCLHKIQL